MKCKTKPPHKTSSGGGGTHISCSFFLDLQCGYQTIMRDQMQTSLFPCSSNQSAVALLFTQSAIILILILILFMFVYSSLSLPFDIQFSTQPKRRFIAFHHNFMMKWFLYLNTAREKNTEKVKEWEKIDEFFFHYLYFRRWRWTFLFGNKIPINLQLQQHGKINRSFQATNRSKLVCSSHLLLKSE